jgi:hypothetical protein
MIQMNRKKNHSIDQKMSMNETSATIMASSLSVVFCDQGNGHYIPRAVAFWAGSPGRRCQACCGTGWTGPAARPHADELDHGQGIASA